MDEAELRPLLVIGLAYLIGSIPFGYLIVRLKKGDDVRTSGSGGTGATNVSRRAGKAAGLLTLVLDASKGAAAVLFAAYEFGVPIFNELQFYRFPEVFFWWIAAAGVAAIVGHMFPVWLGYRGGKGVATAVGVFAILAPWPLALTGLLFVFIVWSTRYVSLGSIVAAVTLPAIVVLHNIMKHDLDLPTTAAGLASAGLIVFAHRANIGRLVEGTESKFK